jgi:hypothetical protein
MPGVQSGDPRQVRDTVNPDYARVIMPIGSRRLMATGHAEKTAILL